MVTRLEKVLVHRPHGFWRVDIVDEFGVTFAHKYQQDYHTAVKYGNDSGRIYQLDVKIIRGDDF